MFESPSRDLNTGPADYKSAALPTKPLRRHMILSVDSKKGGAPISLLTLKRYIAAGLSGAHFIPLCFRTGLPKQIIRLRNGRSSTHGTADR